MKLKSKIKDFFIFFTFFVLFISSIFILSFNKQNLLTEIHATNESLISMDLGYSSLFNIINDGTEEFLGDYKQTITSKLKNLFLNIPKIIMYKIGFVEKENFEKIYLDINFKNYQIILEDRNKVLKKGHAINEKFREVNANVWNNGKKYKAKVRLKGILNTHWYNERRMSLKIKLSKNETIMGYNEFSIQKPRERQWPFNKAFEKFSAKNGILSTNSDLLKVVVNGRNWGVMLLEQSLNKNFLENKKKKEGLIFKFGNEQIWYEGWTSNPYYLYRLGDPTLNYRVYNINKIINSESLQENIHNRKIISYVLNKFENYDSNLFDNQKMSTAFYSSLVWGQFHNLLNNNTSYYFNPYLLKLEPIVRDQYSIETFNNKSNIQQWPPPIQFLKSLKITEYEKNEILKKIYKNFSSIEEEFLKAKILFPVDALKTTNILNQNINIINNNKKEFINFNEEEYYKILDNGINIDFYQNEQFKKHNGKIQLQNENQKNRIKKILHFNHYKNGKIKIYNLLTEPIIINKIIHENTNIIKEKILIPGYLDNGSPFILNTNLKGFKDNSIYIESEFNNKTYKNVNLFTLFENVKNPLLNNTKIPNFIKIKNDKYFIQSGEYFVKENINLEGQLIIEEGVNLKFDEEISIIIKGSIIAEGEKNNQIFFESADSTWGGIYVFDSKDDSKLSNVVLKNMSGLRDSILKLTGSINFYKTNVELENVEFINNYSEDALNIIDSEFKITNIKFINTLSDALDSDYSSGFIKNTILQDIGGDGLDFSGSEVFINNVLGLNIKDKAISVGENSNIDIYDLKLEKVGVGVAVKDGSFSQVNNCQIKDVNLYPFMTYIKKKMYLFPELQIKECTYFKSEKNKNIKISDPSIKYFRQVGTILTDDSNKKILEKKLDVSKLYENTVMSK